MQSPSLWSPQEEIEELTDKACYSTVHFVSLMESGLGTVLQSVTGFTEWQNPDDPGPRAALEMPRFDLFANPNNSISNLVPHAQRPRG